MRDDVSKVVKWKLGRPLANRIHHLLDYIYQNYIKKIIRAEGMSIFEKVERLLRQILIFDKLIREQTHLKVEVFVSFVI